MKKFLRTLYVCIMVFQGIPAQAQQPEVAWALSFGGSGNDRANSIATDAEGNCIVVGRYQSAELSVGTFTLTKCKDDSPDVADLFIFKLDKNGKTLWAIGAGGKGDDHATGCTTDKQGNIYVTGWFECKDLALGKITLHNKTEKGCDMFIAKFSPQGECQWAHNAGGDGNNGDYGTVSTDAKNHVMVSGIAGKQMDFGNGHRLTNKGKSGYAAIYSKDGELLRVHGTTGISEGHGCGADAKGNYYWGGIFSSPALSMYSMTLSNLSEPGELDVFAVKYNAEGKLQWAKSLGGKGSEVATCRADAKGNVYLGGLFFSDTLPVEKDRLINKGEGNVFMVKFSTDGNTCWARSAGGGPKGTGARNFCVDAKGNVFITGSNFADFSFGADSVKNAAGAEDVFVMKYNPDGKEMWAMGFGGQGRNAGRGITTDKKGNLFLAGSFEEKSMPVGKEALKNAGDADIFVIKFREKSK